MSDIVSLIEEAWPDLRIEKEIGQGSNSRVYSADIRDAAEKGGVAIKAVVTPDDWERMDNLQAQGYSDDEIESYLESRVQKSLSETQCMMNLRDSPHVVQIEDCKVLHPQRFKWFVLIRMERLTPLVKAVVRGQLSPLRVGLELCDALHFCHSKRILHRDIKPSNIFVDKDGTCKLGDFSISKKFDLSEGTVTSVGTPQFMAPEVYKVLGETTSYENAVKTDLYSLGLVLYWLLNKCTMPFLPLERIATQDEKQKAFERRISGEPLPLLPQVDPAIMAVIRKAANPIPEKRYKSAAEMKEALQAAESQGAKLSRSLVKGTVMLMSALMVLALVAIILCATGIIKRPQTVLSEQPAQIETSGNKEPVLPEGLNLPLPDKEEFWNVKIFMPPFTGIWREGQSELWRAFDETAIEENWVASGVGENQTYRQCLENMLSSDFLLYRDGLRADIVIIIQQDEDLGDIIQRFTQAGMPVYQFSSTEPTAVHREWVALLEGSAE